MFSIKEAIKFGWAKAKQHIWLFCLVTLVVLGISLVSSALNNIFRHEAILAMLVNLAMNVFSLLVSITIITVMLRLARGETITFTQAVDGFKKLIAQDIGLILAFLIVSVCLQFVVWVGIIALIVPGIYFALKYSQALYLIVDKKIVFNVPAKGFGNWWRETKRVVSEAFRTSAEMTKGVKWQLIKFGLAYLGIAIVAIIPGIVTLGIGLVFLWTMMQFSYVYVYMKLLERVQGQTIAEPTSTSIPMQAA